MMRVCSIVGCDKLAKYSYYDNELFFCGKRCASKWFFSNLHNISILSRVKK